MAPGDRPEMNRQGVLVNKPYKAFQFIPTKNAGDADFQMADIQFEGADGAVIDMSDCRATDTGGTACIGACDQGRCQAGKVIDDDIVTKWCQVVSTSIADLVLLISCSTPKTVVKFRWATANDVSRPAHAYQCC